MHFSDAKLFLKRLRSLEQQDPGPTYFRGQTKDWPLIPTACRRDNEWTCKWIEKFVKRHRQEYYRFLCYKWEGESDEYFQIRFELALRDYIEKDIQYQFQQFATERNMINLSNVEQVGVAVPVQILEYLKQAKIPLTGQTRYASLLAQHHGVPTRLLDWTLSLDVCIGFAVNGVSDSTGEIVVWVIKHWNNKSGSIDPDCDKSRYTITITNSGHDTSRMLMELPLHGTCLKVFSPPDEDKKEMYVRQEERESRVQIDIVNEVYINDQMGNAITDMYHDRHYYKNSCRQSIDARLSGSNIPKNCVYKFTLPYSEIPRLLRLNGDFSVNWIYDLEMYAQFDDDDQPRDISVEDKRRIRECNFLNLLGQRINFDIDWDTFDI